MPKADSDDNKPKADNSYIKKKDGFEIESKDPIFDVMSDKEIEEANKRIQDLLEEED